MSPSRTGRVDILCRAVQDEPELIDWVRHYGALLAALVGLGVVLAAAVVATASRPYEAWTTLVQRGDKIPPLELGRTAQAIFRSEAVYGPVLEELELGVDPATFLAAHAELRPVPETDALEVVGSADDPDEAQRIADGMATSLQLRLKERRLATLVLFGRAAPIERGITPVVAGAAGAAGGLWLGLAAAVIHFRFRRPALTMRRAIAVVEPEHLAIVEARRPAWLGVLRRVRSWRRTPRALSALAQLAEPDDGPLSGVLAVGVADATAMERELAERIRSMAQTRTLAAATAGGAGGTLEDARLGTQLVPGNAAPGRTVLVAHPGTPLAALRDAREEARREPALEGGHLDLVWLR